MSKLLSGVASIAKGGLAFLANLAHASVKSAFDIANIFIPDDFTSLKQGLSTAGGFTDKIFKPITDIFNRSPKSLALQKPAAMAAPSTSKGLPQGSWQQAVASSEISRRILGLAE